MYQRLTIEIFSTVNDSNVDFRATTELYTSSACAQFDAKLVSTASSIEAITVGSNLASLNINVESVNVTINNGLLVALMSNCDGGGWSMGESRLLNKSCVVLGLPLPAPPDCPVYYSMINYDATTLNVADLYQAHNGTVLCSPSQRFTNFTTGPYFLGGYGARTTCEPIASTSVCAPFIDYNVSVPICQEDACSPEQCQKINVESENIYVSVLPQIWTVLSSPECRISVARLLCATAYPRCGSPASLCTCDLNCSASDLSTLNRLLGLFGSSSSALCPGGSGCHQLPSYPALPIPSLANAPNQSALKPSPLVAYPTCALYDGVPCRGLVDYPVYIPKFNSLYLMEQSFTKDLWFAFGLAPKGACYDALTKLACASVFTRCDSTAVNALLAPGPKVEVPLPRLPCRSLCETYNESCASFIALAPGALTRQCEAKSDSVVGCDNVTGDFRKTATGADTYPVNETVIEATIGLRTTCTDITVMGVLAPPLCPNPFVVPENPAAATINDGYCALPCTATWKHPFATPGWNRFFSTLIILSCISSLWTVLTYVLFRSRLLRTQTQIYGFHTIVNMSIAALTSMPAVLKDPSTAISSSTCLDNTEEMTIADPYCAITGVLMTFFTSTSCLFLMAFITDLWFVVSMTAQKWSQEFREKVIKCTFGGIYSYAIGFIILAIATGKIHQNNQPFCFVHDWVGNMFYIVLCITLIVDCVFFGLIVRVIWGSYRQTSVINPKESSLRTGISQFRRPIIFTILCVFLFVLAASARLQSQILEKQWKQNAVDWVLCKVVRSHFEGEVCTEYPVAFDHGFLWLTLTAIFSQGLMISAILGFSGQNFALWRDVIVNRILPKSFISRSKGSQIDSSFSRESGSNKNLPKVVEMENPALSEDPSISSTSLSGVSTVSTASSTVSTKVKSTKSKRPKSYSRGFFVQSSRKVEFVPFD